MPTKSGLKTFREIERSLKRFFRLFDDLCHHCFDTSMAAISSAQRPHSQMCCCLVDNQAHDHWQSLSEAQQMMNGPNWARDIEQNTFTTGKRRMPNNGPCKALCASGCVLSSIRPPSCSTLICGPMVKVLVELNLIAPRALTNCEVDELLGVPSPLDQLYGIKPGDASVSQVQRFCEKLSELDRRFREVPQERRSAAIANAKVHVSSIVGGKRK